MKNRTYILLFALALVTKVLAQSDVTLPGEIVMQNSLYLTGQREYVARASIRSTTKCIPTTSDTKGRFTLIFSDKPAGDEARIFVTKDGLEVVNEKDLEEAAVIGRLSPLKVVMCKKGTLTANKQLYYQITDEAIKKIYDARLKALLQKQGNEYNDVIAALKKELNTTIADSEEAISALKTQFLIQKKQIKELVDKFALENLDDESETYRKAFEAFTNGQVDSALAILEKVDIEKRLATNAAQIKKAAAAIDLLQENINKKETQMKQDINHALLEARMHKLKYQFNKAKDAYELVIKYDSTNKKIIFEYASFLADINDLKRKAEINQTSLSIFKKLSEENTAYKKDYAFMLVANALHNGITLNQIHLAETQYLEAIDIYRKYGSRTSVARAYNLLGQLYGYKKDMKSSHHYFMMANNIFKDLVKNDSSYKAEIAMNEDLVGLAFWGEDNDIAVQHLMTGLKTYKTIPRSASYYKPEEFAMIVHHLGQVNKDRSAYAIAEKYYHEAFALYQEISVKEPVQYMKLLGEIERDLGEIYHYRKDYSKSEAYYLNSINRYNGFGAEKASFSSDLAGVKNLLGNLYKSMDNYHAAEEQYLEALKLYGQAARKQAGALDQEIALVHNNLGLLFKLQKDYEKATEEFVVARKIYEEASVKDSSVLTALINTINNEANLYKDAGEFSQAEKIFFEALEKTKLLSLTDLVRYRVKLAHTYNNLGNLYLKENSYSKSEAAFLKAESIREELVERNIVYRGDLAGTLNDLGNLYYHNNEHEKASAKYQQALNLYKQLATENGDKYNPDVAMVYKNMGLNYRARNDFKNAETAYLKSLKIRQELAENNLRAYQGDYFANWSSLLSFYQDMADSSKEKSVYDKYRLQASSLYDTVSNRFRSETFHGIPANTCGNVSWHLLFSGQFEKAERAARWGLQIDSTQIWIMTNLAHSLLLQNKFEEAKTTYLFIRDKKDEVANKLYRDILMEDFAFLEKGGISHPDINKIKALLLP